MPTTHGSIPEGGESGYPLSQAFRAAPDDDLVAVCVIDDGKAEAGRFATAWDTDKLLSPVADGSVLPILHPRFSKIREPTAPAGERT